MDSPGMISENTEWDPSQGTREWQVGQAYCRPPTPPENINDDKWLSAPGAPRSVAAHISEADRVKRRLGWRRQVKQSLEENLPLPHAWINPDYQHPPCDVTFRVKTDAGTGAIENTDWSVTYRVDDPLTVNVDDLNRLIKNTAPLTIKSCFRDRPDRAVYPDERYVLLNTKPAHKMRSVDDQEIYRTRNLKLWELLGHPIVHPKTNIASIQHLWNDPTKIELELDIYPNLQ